MEMVGFVDGTSFSHSGAFSSCFPQFHSWLGTYVPGFPSDLLLFISVISVFCLYAFPPDLSVYDMILV